MPKKKLTTTPDDPNPLEKLLKALERFISDIPQTDEHKSSDSEGRARNLANTAAAKAALVSGSLALPPGPLGYATLLPDLVAIWKLQAQWSLT